MGATAVKNGARDAREKKESVVVWGQARNPRKTRKTDVTVYESLGCCFPGTVKQERGESRG